MRHNRQLVDDGADQLDWWEDPRWLHEQRPVLCQHVHCRHAVVGENITPVQRENNKPLKTPMGDKAGV